MFSVGLAGNEYPDLLFLVCLLFGFGELQGAARPADLVFLRGRERGVVKVGE